MLVFANSCYFYLVLDLKNLKVSVGEVEADVVVEASDDTLVQIATKQMTVEEAREAGKLKAEGNPELIKALRHVTNKLLTEA